MSSHYEAMNHTTADNIGTKQLQAARRAHEQDSDEQWKEICRLLARLDNEAYDEVTDLIYVYGKCMHNQGHAKGVIVGRLDLYTQYLPPRTLTEIGADPEETF